MSRKKLSAWTKLKYGVGDFGMAVVTAILQFGQNKYYTDSTLIDPWIIGLAMLLGKITWDLANDVLFGYLEDKTKSKWGKRRPYLIFGAVPFAITFWIMFSLPVSKGNQLFDFFIIIATFILFDTFHTLTNTAYSAMTAEITDDYDERTSLTTYRMVFSVIGYLVGAATSLMLPGMVADMLGKTLQEGWSIVSLVVGILAGSAIIIPGLFLKYTPAVEDKPPQMPPMKAIITTLKNKPFVSYLIVTMIMSVSFTMVTSMLGYYIDSYLKLEGLMGTLIMIAMLVVLGIFLVPCGIISNKIGKAKTYALGLSIASAALIGVFFLPADCGIWIYILAAIAGMGFSAQWVCPHSMIPDVIEYDELVTGERREGVYYGMQATATKVTAALASLITNTVLDIAKYDAKLGVQNQPESAQLAIRILFALVPAVFLLICVPLLIKYPISKESHAEVLRQLEERRKQKKEAE